MKRLLAILLALLLLTASLASCTVQKSGGTEATATDATGTTTELPPESTDEPEGPARTKHAETTPAATEPPAPATTASETTAPETTDPGDPDDDYTKNY